MNLELSMDWFKETNMTGNQVFVYHETRGNPVEF
jgi:hypothetical protein